MISRLKFSATLSLAAAATSTFSGSFATTFATFAAFEATLRSFLPWSAAFTAFLASFEVVFLAHSLPFLIANSVYSATSFLSGATTVLSRHDLIEVCVSHIIAFLTDPLLQLLDLVEVITLFLMLGLHLEVFEGFVEFLVLCSSLLLLERLDLCLLLEEAALDFGHVLVRFEHLSEEVVWTRNRHLGLDKELHALHHILSC